MKKRSKILAIYSELKNAKNISNIPQINFNDLKLLWHEEFWDGPINGILLYQNKKCWFEMISENDGSEPDDYYRRYWIIKLSQKQIEDKEFWHNLFREKVGNNADYDDDGIRHTDQVKPFEMHNEYFELAKKREEIDLSNNLVLGFYEV